MNSALAAPVSEMPGIYLDHAATTPLDPKVLEAMLPHLGTSYGNASSVHRLGRKARHVVEECRERIAARLGASAAEIVFTSGGTEADNAALRGVLTEASMGLLTSEVEHEPYCIRQIFWPRADIR